MQSLKSKCEFSPEHYNDILLKIREHSDCELTHDIDILPVYALSMAKMEYQLGIKSTYYIHLHSEFYNPLSPESLKQFRAIRDLGHELALHYNTNYESDTFKLLETLSFFKTMFNTNSDKVSRHFVDLSDKINIPYWLTDRGEYIKNNNYHYVADSGGWFRKGCFCEHFDKPSLFFVVHPVWWFGDKYFVDADIRAKGIINRATLYWRNTVAEHRKQQLS